MSLWLYFRCSVSITHPYYTLACQTDRGFESNGLGPWNRIRGLEASKTCCKIRCMILWSFLMNNRPEQSIETIPSFDQWSLTIKTIETNGQRTPKPLIKIIDVNGQSAKNIQWWWFPRKPLKITMVLQKPFTSIQINNCFLNLKWILWSEYCEMFPVLFVELIRVDYAIYCHFFSFSSLWKIVHRSGLTKKRIWGKCFFLEIAHHMC